MISVSIVSHGHASMLSRLVQDLLNFEEIENVIITWNLKHEYFPINRDRVVDLVNQIPKGFGENHNAAFELANAKFFAVLNPDLIFLDNPFPKLIRHLLDEKVVLCAPTIVNAAYRYDGNFRKFPTIWSLFLKLFGADFSLINPIGPARVSPDWVAGMFMLFRSSTFNALKGFDECYKLYYEDVDICRRIMDSGGEILGCCETRVQHLAQRTSHRDPAYLVKHLKSMHRFLKSEYQRKCRVQHRPS